MREIIVDLNIPKDEWLKIYRGQTNLVYALSRDGRSIQFPANILSPYTTHFGVQGSFVIRFSDEGKFLSISKL
ncbi:MAG: DUF2835 domain-containing protein [Oleiphilaceae bacterium]|nr:DUF2835 domain-containing protein [Oleiphilaceae bacterium]